MSTAPDKQFVALATLSDGSVQLVDYRRPAGSTHRIVREAGDAGRLILDLGDITAPVGCADALKVSRVENASLTADTVIGGTEDVLDMTWCRHVRVLHADRPDCLGTFKVNVPWWRGLFVTCYPLLKKLRLA